MNLEATLWGIAQTAPTALAILGGAAYLFTRRRTLGRPGVVAAAVLVGLFVFNVLIFYGGTLVGERINAKVARRDNWDAEGAIVRGLYVLRSVGTGVAVLLLAWCVVRGRR